MQMTANGPGQSENKHWKEGIQSHLRLQRGDIQKHSWQAGIYLRAHPCSGTQIPFELLKISFLPQISCLVLVVHRCCALPSLALALSSLTCTGKSRKLAATWQKQSRQLQSGKKKNPLEKWFRCNLT